MFCPPLCRTGAEPAAAPAGGVQDAPLHEQTHKETSHTASAVALCSVLPSAAQALRPLQYRLEVYKTRECGWGVQSWDTVVAGSLVCVMIGRIMRCVCMCVLCRAHVHMHVRMHMHMQVPMHTYVTGSTSAQPVQCVWWWWCCVGVGGG